MQVPRRRCRRPVLRHRLPRHAGRPDRRGARAVRAGSASRSATSSRPACGAGGRENAEKREPHHARRPEAFGLDLDAGPAAVRRLRRPCAALDRPRLKRGAPHGHRPDRRHRPRARVRVRRTAGRPRDAGLGELLGLRRPRRGRACRASASRRSRELGRPRHSGQRRRSPTAGCTACATTAATLAGRRVPTASRRVLGAGPLGFRCVEPFRHLDDDVRRPGRADVDRPTSPRAARTARWSTSHSRSRRRMAVPPWVQGALQADAAAALETSVEGDLMGGDRYEQLFRAHRLGAGGRRRARLHRQRPADPPPGRPPARGFWGHCWQSALFPSGRRSATSPTRRGPTASRRSTRATCFARRRRARPGPSRRGAVADDAAAARRGRLGGAGDAPTASADRGRDGVVDLRHPPRRATFREERSPRWPTGRSLRCSRPACATAGTARRPTACSSARLRWTRSLASLALHLSVAGAVNGPGPVARSCRTPPRK